MEQGTNNRRTSLIIGLIIVFLTIVIKLFSIQIIDGKYKINANNNALIYKTLYPVRGLIYDRNKEILVGNQIAYDILVTPLGLKPFDTLAFCEIFDIDTQYVHNTFAYYKKYRSKIGYQSRTLLKLVTSERYNKFLEKSHRFPGFYGVARTIRKYPYNAGGNLLGYIGEANADFLNKNPDYEMGDYVGIIGFEKLWEEQLRGKKGHNIFLRDVKNVIHSSYENGEHDLDAIPGTDMMSTIDAELQAYGEKLMTNKIGSIVAIEPSSGEILSMVTSPGINVNQLANIGSFYKEISENPYKPMFNRTIMSPQPPGSPFKLINALIGLQEGIVTQQSSYNCYEGYHAGNLHVGCHYHKPNTNFEESIMISCNAFYCDLYRRLIDNSKYNSPAEALDLWNKYVRSFGFGDRVSLDFPNEDKGSVPSSETYNKMYGKRRWRALTTISLAIGQGELTCTPIQLANLAAILANRGHYYPPHLTKGIFTNIHHSLVDKKYFPPVIEGMYRAVNAPLEDGGTGRMAKIEGLEICGKTGTAQNPHGKDHSVFICFAPKENPKIAIAVYVENAGWGGTWAAPIASLMVEKYINREIDSTRTYKEESIINANLLTLDDK